MKTRAWCLASASALCLCVGTPTFADNAPSAQDQLRGAAPNRQLQGNGPQGPQRPPQPGYNRPDGPRPGVQRPNYLPPAYQATPYQPAPHEQPNYSPPGNQRPGMGPGPQNGQGWQANPNGNDRPPPPRPDNSLPIQPKPGEVRQTEPPLIGSYPDLPRPHGGPGWQGGGYPDHNWDARPHGNGWGPGPQYRPGQRIDRFPGDNYRVPYRGSDYYFSSGYWYRPDRGGYIVTPPPRGIRVRYLPEYASRVWIGGGMFFVAAGTYYQWLNDTQEYVVVDTPIAPAQSRPQPVTPTAGYDVAFYPATGQTASQMEQDRYACQNWAAQQTGFNPETATYAPSEQVVNLFRQSMANCLTSRGYGLN